MLILLKKDLITNQRITTIVFICWMALQNVGNQICKKWKSMHFEWVHFYVVYVS